MANTKILIVEDEKIVAVDIKNALGKLGYTVTSIISSGEEAIQKASEDQPDLVLMDIMLKGSMNGVESAKKIRGHLDIPVVYLTAYGDDDTLQIAKTTEPFGYILKPFEARELHVGIEIALYKYKMEKKLKESERWFSTTLKCIGDAVIATDKEGLIKFMNPVAEKLTGWEIKDAIDKDLINVFNIINVRTRIQAENPVKKTLREGAVSSLKDYTILITKDGYELHVDYNATHIRDEKTGVIGVVLAFHDITRQKQAEKQIRLYNEKLEDLVKKRTERIKELEMQRTEIEKMVTTGQVAALIAHEINNPIAGIKNSFLLIKDAVPVNHKYHEYVGKIESEIERVANIVSQMFSMYRQQKEKPHEFDVVERVRDVMVMLEGTSSKHSVRMDLDTCGTSAMVKLPEGLLKQILYNVIKNAIEASPVGGIVKVVVSVKDDNLTIKISDQGKGIPEELKSKIFERFFTTKGNINTGGLGLGLSISKGIVETMGGSLDFISIKDKETVFTVSLPNCVTKNKICY